MGSAKASAVDAELLRACRRGERAAFGELVERYQALVCAVSYGATGNRALSEDVAQETFLAAWRGLDSLREPARLKPWLCGIARNLGRKARRRARRETPAETEAVASAASPFEATASAETERIVDQALRGIPASYREALVLYYREGRSTHEVATALGISDNAAQKRLSRGRKMLSDNVASVVASCLERTRPRPGFAAAVVAGLPPAGAPHVAQPQHGETSVMKIALIAGALAAAGTTAVIVHQTRDREPASATEAVASDARAGLSTPSAAAPERASARTATSARPALDEAGPRTVMAPEPDTEPRVDAGDIERLSLYRGPSRGPDDAPVTIVVFGDFQCHFCARVLGTIDELWDDYPGQLKLVVKQLPVRPNSQLTAEAAIAAEAQGKFWELHDLMYAHQDDLSREVLMGLAERAGLDVARFRRDLEQHTYAGAVAEDTATARELDIRGTPSFLINGKRFVGARPIDTFRAMIDAELGRVSTRPLPAHHGGAGDPCGGECAAEVGLRPVEDHALARRREGGQ